MTVRARPGLASVPVPVAALAALAWILAIVAALTGRLTLPGHHELLGGSGGHGDRTTNLAPQLWAALALFLVAWQVHVAAMMLPSSLPLVRLFHRVTAGQARPVALRAAFLAGYLAVWTGFGALAFAGDAALHLFVQRSPWLAERSWLLAGLAVGLAGLFQFTELKDRCLSECRHPAGFLTRHYRRGVPAAFTLGVRHGLFCLGCCWALMLVLFAVGAANLVWMVPLALLMFVEKASRFGDRLAAPAGAILLGIAILIFAQPSWLPPTLLGT